MSLKWWLPPGRLLNFSKGWKIYDYFSYPEEESLWFTPNFTANMQILYHLCRSLFKIHNNGIKTQAQKRLLHHNLAGGREIYNKSPKEASALIVRWAFITLSSCKMMSCYQMVQLKMILVPYRFLQSNAHESAFWKLSWRVVLTSGCSA